MILYPVHINHYFEVEVYRSSMKARKNIRSQRRSNPRKTAKRGRGLVDKIIDKLPFELHLPKYQYCGPGTKLAERLARGDSGINKLDELCKDHDIAYATHNDSAERYKADKILGSEAMKRVFSKDAKLSERAASLLVSTAMKAKTGLTKIGAGISKLNCKKKSKNVKFATLIRDAKLGIKKSKAKTVDCAIRAAMQSAKKSAKGKRVNVPRIIKVPTYTGGILPILPILAGLSAVGSIGATTAGIFKTIRDMKIAQKQLEENKRHNKAMEIKVGEGLYLKPYSNGSGLYLKPYSKNVL